MGVFDIVMEKPGEVSRGDRCIDIVMKKPAEVSRRGEAI
jgi:hypothetical protein